MDILTTILRSGHKIDVLRDEPTEDAAGARVSALKPIWTDEPAWVQPNSRNTTVVHDGRAIRVDYTVYVTRDLGIRTGDVIEFLEKKLSVIGSENQGGMGRLFAIYVKGQL